MSESLLYTGIHLLFCSLPAVFDASHSLQRTHFSLPVTLGSNKVSFVKRDSNDWAAKVSEDPICLICYNFSEGTKISTNGCRAKSKFLCQYLDNYEMILFHQSLQDILIQLNRSSRTRLVFQALVSNSESLESPLTLTCSKCLIPIYCSPYSSHFPLRCCLYWTDKVRYAEYVPSSHPFIALKRKQRKPNCNLQILH